MKMKNEFQIGDLVAWKPDFSDNRYPTVGLVTDVVPASDVIDTLIVVQWGEIEDAYSLWDCQWVLRKI